MQLPAGLSQRGVEDADLPAVLGLLNAASRDVAGSDEFSAGMLRKAWSTPGLDRARDTRVLLAPDGTPAGYAELWWRAPGLLTELWAQAAPRHPLRRELCAALLAWGEDRARQASRAAPRGVRLALDVETDARDATWQSALGARGFRAARQICRLRRELADAPALATGRDDGIRVRSLRPGVDETAAYAALGAAFRDDPDAAATDPEQGLLRFQYWMAADPDFDPELFWLAWDGARVAGFLFAFPACEADAGAARIPSLGVLRPWRRRGLGRSLLLHAFTALARRGLARVCLEVDADNRTGALALYRGAGMVETRRFAVWEQVLREGSRATAAAT